MIVQGVPIAKKRPRFKRAGQFVRTYNVQEKEMVATRLTLKSLWNKEPLEGALTVHLFFNMPIPKSLSKKRKEELIREPHTKKPDIDNLVKYILDCMNGIVFKDDSQIAEINASKQYNDEPYTHIMVW